MRRVFAGSLAILGAVTAFVGPSKADDSLQIMTGSTSGLYYAAGEAICNAIASGKGAQSRTCRPIASDGSMSNLLELDPDTTQLAIAQSDVQYNAVTGSGLFATVGADRDLRGVFSLHEESFTILVRADAPISSLDDLRGRTFSAGRTGTGTRETAEALVEVLGWSPEERSKLLDLPIDQQAAALCTGKVEAIAYFVGHPSAVVANAARTCPVKFVSVPREAAEELARKLLYYHPAAIAADHYLKNANLVPTVGLRAAVVTKAGVPDRTIRNLLAAVFGNLDILRSASPAFAGLRPDVMSTQGLIAPLHPAALEFYRANGLPTPTIESAPSSGSPIADGVGSRQMPKNLIIDPKLSIPTENAQGSAKKPTSNSVPVGPRDKWKLESGQSDTNGSALDGDLSLPDAESNIRLRIPTEK